jgi:hypothetical protein
MKKKFDDTWMIQLVHPQVLAGYSFRLRPMLLKLFSSWLTERQIS